MNETHTARQPVVQDVSGRWPMVGKLIICGAAKLEIKKIRYNRSYSERNRRRRIGCVGPLQAFSKERIKSWHKREGSIFGGLRLDNHIWRLSIFL